MYYKVSKEKYEEQKFREFILLLISEIKRGRRHGYVRLWLYPHEADFLVNDNKYIAIFIRKKDIYVVGTQHWNGTKYEIGRITERGRYFFDSEVTGFGQQYRELFEGSHGNLKGVYVGFDQLNKEILTVIVEPHPLRWPRSVGMFALIFSESARFIWFEEVISRLMEQEWNLPMEGNHLYMSKLPKRWLEISNCARRTLRRNERYQLVEEKYTVPGVAELELQLLSSLVGSLRDERFWGWLKKPFVKFLRAHTDGSNPEVAKDIEMGKPLMESVSAIVTDSSSEAGEASTSDNNPSTSIIDAQRCMSLYFALCTKSKHNWVVDMYYKVSGEKYEELKFREFILLLISEIKRGRRHGYVRLWLYPHEADFLVNDNKYIAIFIRKKDIYVVGTQHWNGTIYEIGRITERGRYFFDSEVTGFGQQYRELFEGSHGNLEGVYVGFDQLNKEILTVIVEPHPLRWPRSVGMFALIFSESARFIWFEEVISRLMEQEWNLPMEGNHLYMSKLPKRWLEISNCARRTLRRNERYQPQLVEEKYTVPGVAELE
nr:symplekin isoform X2 [Tanacetum cinerariifolium]